jgi:CrcB protein
VALVNAALLVAAGGMAGATARHLLGERIDARTRDTLAVNVAGSFALGLLVGAGADGDVAHLLATGFCGAFTTFSTFAFETVRLAETGQLRAAAWYAAVTLVAALAAVAVGTALGTALAP